MRPLSITINGRLVDLPASTKGLVKFSQARSALADISARVGEFSFPLTFPFTRRNEVTFGVDKLHPLGLRKFGPYTDYAYELRCEGQVFAGTFRLSSLKNGYTGNLIGDGLSWALLLGDSKLTDLVFPVIDYDGSQLEAVLAQDCDSTDVQFPLVAYANFFTPPTLATQPDGSTKEVPVPAAAVLDYPLSVDDYPPGVYYSNVLKQIFAGIGWQLQSRELDSELWRAVVLLPAGADLSKAWPWGALLPASATSAAAKTQELYSYYGGAYVQNGNLVTNSYANTAGEQFDETNDIFYLPLRVPLIGTSPTRALDPAAGSYTAPIEGVYTFDWAATVVSASQAVDSNGQPNTDGYPKMTAVVLGLVVRRGGQNWEGCDGGLCTNTGGVLLPNQQRAYALQYLHYNNSSGQLRTGAFGATDSIYLQAGDVVNLVCFARRVWQDADGDNGIWRRQFDVVVKTISLACTSYVDNNGVSKTQLQPADFLPPLAQRDVVRDFMQRVDGFIVADTGRRVATVLSRAELSTAGGAPIDLAGLCDARAVEYSPAAGVGVGSFVFSPAENGDDPLTPTGTDVVTAPVGTGDGQQAIGSLFAPVATRTTYILGGQAALPVCSTADILSQNRSEAQADIGSEPPRLLRYTGPDAGFVVPFMQRTVPLARAAWDGPLAWDGTAGAVARYYADTLRRAVDGHLGRVQVPISPGLYQQLQPGRKVYLHGGAAYTVEALQNFDPADEAGLCQLDLSREVL